MTSCSGRSVSTIWCTGLQHGLYTPNLLPPQDVPMLLWKMATLLLLKGYSTLEKRQYYCGNTGK